MVIFQMGNQSKANLEYTELISRCEEGVKIALGIYV